MNNRQRPSDKIEVSLFSQRYRVREMETADIELIFSLCSGNGLYYQYYPPFVTRESISEDLQITPPGKDISDKYYVGFYDRDRLIAVMDFIRAYPNEQTDFIGFFMTDASVHNRGVGTEIIEDLCSFLPQTGCSRLRLGYVKGNPQAERFWHKNGFIETGEEYVTDTCTIVAAERILRGVSGMGS